MSEEAAKIINYKCPNCAAPLVFSIENQRWDCHFCDSTFEKSQIEVISSSVGTEETQQASWTAELFNEEDMVAYTCPDCGGRVLADQNTISSFCAYCHNPNVLASRIQGIYRPARILPFKIPKDHVLTELQKLLQKKPLLPKVFRECIEKGEITGLYAPYWLFSATVNGSLAAQCTKVSSWTDADYSYTKTDVFDVQRECTIPFEHIPVDASLRLDDTLMDSIEPFDYRDLTDFSMQYLSGHFAESFDLSASTSYQRFLSRAGETTNSLLRNSVGSYTSVRIVRSDVNPLNPQNLYALLPVWTIAAKHNNKTYSFIMNGQTGKSAGNLPISWGRFFFILVGTGLGLAIIIMIISLLTGGSSGFYVG